MKVENDRLGLAASQCLLEDFEQFELLPLFLVDLRGTNGGDPPAGPGPIQVG